MERLDRRLAEAAAALATLDELAGKSERTLVERDGAVLRLIYSYEAIWKACQKVLAALENVSAASPNATTRSICIATRLGSRSRRTSLRTLACFGAGSMPCRSALLRIKAMLRQR